MTLDDFFNGLISFANTFFYGVNQIFKLFFNDIQVFGVALGWWFLMFSLFSMIVVRVGGVE